MPESPKLKYQGYEIDTEIHDSNSNTIVTMEPCEDWCRFTCANTDGCAGYSYHVTDKHCKIHTCSTVKLIPSVGEVAASFGMPHPF